MNWYNPQNTLAILVPSGISNSSWCLSETARGQLGKAQCLGDGEDRRCKSHSMECPADTHWPGLSLFHCPFLEDTSETAPCLPSCAGAVSSTSQLPLQTGLGRQVYTWSSENSVSNWQHFSENKSDAQFDVVFSHGVSTWLLLSTYYFKTKLQQYLKMSNILYKISMLWGARGSRKGFSRNVTGLCLSLAALYGKYFWLH